MQIRDQIVRGIGSGELESGERLPSIRALSDDIGVNPMTVSKAYSLLKQEGFISQPEKAGAWSRKKSPRAASTMRKNWRFTRWLPRRVSAAWESVSF